MPPILYLIIDAELRNRFCDAASGTSFLHFMSRKLLIQRMILSLFVGLGQRRAEEPHGLVHPSYRGGERLMLDLDDFGQALGADRGAEDDQCRQDGESNRGR